MFRVFDHRPALLFFGLLLFATKCLGHISANQMTQSQLNRLADHLNIRYEVLGNNSGAECKIQSPCYRVKLTLSLPYDLVASDWKLYIGQLDKLLSVRAEHLTVSLVNGDLKVITPKADFAGFIANQPVTVELELKGDHYTEYKPLPNYYVTAAGLHPAIIASTREVTDPETGISYLPHVVSFTDSKHQFRNTTEDKTTWVGPEELFRDNENLTSQPQYSQYAIIPTPSSFELTETEPADIATGLRFTLHGVSRSPIESAIKHLQKLGVRETPNGLPVSIYVDSQNTFDDEGYSLAIETNDIVIHAKTPTGAAYAITSIAALLQPGNPKLPTVNIEDNPRFSYRGMHLDVARNFHSKMMVLQLLDQMAAYKLNVLHLHLSDDEGWRVEIEGLPELTKIGAFRCHDPSEEHCLIPQLGSGPERNTPVNGYYSKADFIEILTAAKQRHIEVLPSFDMPGHARAAIKAMEARYRRYMANEQPAKATEYLLTDFEDKTQYRSIQNYNDNTINVCLPSAYHFVEKVVDELSAMYQKAGLTLHKYHLGADESPGAWLQSPACQQLLSQRQNTHPENPNLGGYFVERIAGMLADKQIEAAGWNDGLGHTDAQAMPAKVQSHIWALLPDNATQLAHQHLNRGWDVVLSLPDVTYFDMPHEADPKERGYDWAARHINSRKVFSFMPENLPVHAEIWRNLREQPFTIKDTIPKQAGKKVLGIQGHLWSETIRTDWQAENMIFPRLIALAERAWHRASWEPTYKPGGLYGQSSETFSAENRSLRDQQFNQFAATLANKEMLKLDMLSVGYRIPTAGATFKDGSLNMNVIFPGLPLEYRINHGVWHTYYGPVEIPNGLVEVRARSADGRRAGRSLFLPVPDNHANNVE